MKILTGNSNRPLAEAISAKLALPLVKANIRTFREALNKRGGAFQPKRFRPPHPGSAAAHEHVAIFVESAPAGAANHLQQLVGSDFAVEVIVPVAGGGDENGAQGKIDAGTQPEGGDDRPQLTGLGQGFDHPGALRVAQSAVVVSDAGAQEFGEGGPTELFLFRREGERIRQGQLAGKLAGETFLANRATGAFGGGANATYLHNYSFSIYPKLEKETGRIVICNQTAQMWDIQEILGVRKPMPGRNRLLANM